MLMPRTIDKLRVQLPGGNPGGYLLAIVARAASEDAVAAWLRERTAPSQYAAVNATLRRIRPKHAEDEAFLRD